MTTEEHLGEEIKALRRKMRELQEELSRLALKLSEAEEENKHLRLKPTAVRLPFKTGIL